MIEFLGRWGRTKKREELSARSSPLKKDDHTRVRGVVLCEKSESKYNLNAVMKREGSNMLADIYIPHRRCFQIHIDLLSLGGVQADSLSRTPKNELLNEKPNRNIDPGPTIMFEW